MKKYLTIILLSTLVSFNLMGQLTTEYKSYIERSSIENPLKLIDELEARSQETAVKIMLGELYFYAGNNLKASELTLEGIKTLEQKGNILTELYARAFSNYGLILWNEGKNERSLTYLEKSLSIKKDLNSDKESLADTYNNLGLVLRSADQLEEANIAFEKALTLLEEDGTNKAEKLAIININMALLEAESSNYRSAMSILNKLLSQWEKTHEEDLPTEAFILTNLGLIYEKTEQLELARSFYQDAIVIYTNFYGNRNPELANCYGLIANIDRIEGNFKESLINIQKALYANSTENLVLDYNAVPNFQSILKPSYHLALLTIKSSILEDFYFGYSLKKAHLLLAFETLKEADKAINQIRINTSNKKDQLSLNVTASNVYESAQRIAIHLNEVSLFGDQFIKEAFYFSERAKASSLLSAVAESDAKNFANIPLEKIEEETTLKNELAYLNTAIAKSQDTEEIASLKNNLFEAKRKYDQFIVSLEKEYPAYYNLKHNTAPASLEKIQSSLLEGEMLLSYSFAPKHNQVYRYEITKESFNVDLIYEMDQVERNLRAFRNILTYRVKQPFQPIALKLYQYLLPKRIDKDINRLTIIPDGILGIVPFEALISEKTEQNDFWALSYLINTYAVSYNYSASFHTIQHNATRAENALLIAPVNFSESSLTSLPGTKKELEALQNTLTTNQVKCEVLIEQNASEEQFKDKSLPQYKYIHLATHGQVNNDQPELSAIYLSGLEGKEDGILYTSEIYNLNFNADLVSLSACETGLGKLSRGEGILGLGRAFSYAGAQHLLVSLWKVKDESTAYLMENFYSLNFSGSLDYTSSLRKAQIKMIQNGYADPHLWAPFIIWGK